MSNAIESVLVETRVFPPPERASQGASIPSMDAYKELCAQVENDFDGFWAGQARANLKWTKPFTQVLDESDAPFYRWFGDGELNVSANCLDVHLTNGNADKTAIISKPTTARSTASPTANCWPACAASPMAWPSWATRRVTAPSSTCPCRSRRWSPCRPARAWA